MSHLLSAEIISDRLLLVPISLDWAEAIFAEFTTEVARYTRVDPPQEMAGTLAFIHQARAELTHGKSFHVVIVEKSRREFLGCGGLIHLDASAPEFGIWLKKSAWGHKYGQEAIAALKKWADCHITYEYLLYPVARENIPSRKIAEFLGGKIAREHAVQFSPAKLFQILEYRIYPPQ